MKINREFTSDNQSPYQDIKFKKAVTEEKENLILRYHQRLIIMKMLRTGNRDILLAAIQRSGKSYISLFLDY